MIVQEDFFLKMLWLRSSYYPKTPNFEDGYISPKMAIIEATLHGRFINTSI
jgi:hypothetical protein